MSGVLHSSKVTLPSTNNNIFQMLQQTPLPNRFTITRTVQNTKLGLQKQFLFINYYNE